MAMLLRRDPVAEGSGETSPAPFFSDVKRFSFRAGKKRVFPEQVTLCDHVTCRAKAHNTERREPKHVND
jgi:hypothetical protein